MNARAEPLDVLPIADVAPAQLPAVQFNAEKMIELAITKKVPIEMLERLLAMREKLLAEAAKAAFFDALSRFQSECPIIKKNKTANIKHKERDTSHSYKYATLDYIVKIVAPLLTKCGLSYQIVSSLEGRGEKGAYVVARCIVHHVAGHSAFSEFTGPIDTTAQMSDLQKVASAQTFAKRYAFNNALGILTGDTDDDGGGSKRNDTSAGQGESARGEAAAGRSSAALPEYPGKEFLQKLPEWKKLMDAGTRTADQIIATAGSRYTLSEGQKQRIRSASGVSK